MHHPLSSGGARRVSRRHLLRTGLFVAGGLGILGHAPGAFAAPAAPRLIRRPERAPNAAPQPQTPRRGGTYTFGTGQSITGLDPAKVPLLNDRNVYAGLWNGLVKMDEDMRVQPDLAESWEVVDPTTYVFKLRRGVRFHNGRELTADDVKFTLDRIADPATASRWRGFSLPQYDRAEAVDQYTVKLVNKNPFAPQLDALAPVKIVARENVGDIDQQAIGTGPFKLVEFVPDDRVVMERFADYWDADHVYLDRVVVKTIKDATALVQALKTGGVDSIWQMATRDAAEVQRDDRLELYKPKQHAVVQMLMVDNGEAPFNDPRARQALSYATDRDAIVEVAFFGQFEVHPYDHPIPSANWAFNPNLTKKGYDLKKAKDLFDAAGVNGSTPLVFQAISTANPEWVVVGEIMQQSLAEIGIPVTIEKLDLPSWVAVFNPADQKRWPARIITNGNVGYSDPYFYFQTFQQGLLNRNHYQNGDVQSLLDRAATIIDRDQRAALYQRAQELMNDDPACPLPYVQHGLYGKTRALKGFYAEADWVPHYENAWLDR